jgi:hypothetical protein
VALGDTYRAYKPQFFNKPPGDNHSVYAIGQMKPENAGIRDLK